MIDKITEQVRQVGVRRLSSSGMLTSKLLAVLRWNESLIVAWVSCSRIVATLFTGWSGLVPSIDRVLMVSPVSLRETPKHCFKLRERVAGSFVLVLARSIHESGWPQEVCTQVPLHHFLE
jgi:hypothetical protein